MKSLRHLKGAIHVHTDLSHDGTLSLEELREFFLGRKYQFLCLTDHSQNVDMAQFEVLKLRCQELSTASFVFIPGVEYSCEGELHILGLGINAVTTWTDPGAVIDHIHKSDGIAVLAHPAQKKYEFRSGWVSKLDGMEVWNLRNDGRFLPRRLSVWTFLELKSAYPHLLAFFGIDFHSGDHFYDAAVSVAESGGQPRDIICALRAGRYFCTSRWLSCHAHLGWSRSKINLLSILRNILDGLGLARSTVKAWLPAKRQSCT